MERTLEINWIGNDITEYKNGIQIRKTAHSHERWQHTPKHANRISFVQPMTFPDHITVLHKLRQNPADDADHFILDVLILSELHQRPAARCIEDIVVYDYVKGKKAPLKPFMAEAFQNTFKEQELAKKENVERVSGILERVRDLEVKSWDREDAKEKLGV
jgi:hypothetical protein